MANTLTWQPKALKQLEKIKDAVKRKRIYSEAQSLADFPNCPNVKKLVNHDYSYRLRIGDYRVFFEFNGEVHIVSIEEVKKRDERTY
ncbi:type II toxin-antitoxin system RelE family toxin [Methylovulum miyakonense]|uniref:type II toxin-antitoxin system RelE family toxin n=1 Tax=Methylovulum miyakonense TaxID=645578 RepID=UPI0003614CD6|nr:type II toxin-antitoxin system RelE/ParE family toxin [Methylovulum miyakonense]